jgi:hypothetical protein
LLPGGPRVLWETMIFGLDDDSYQERYTSREAALEGHARAVEIVKAWDSEVSALERLLGPEGFKRRSTWR